MAVFAAVTAVAVGVDEHADERGSRRSRKWATHGERVREEEASDLQFTAIPWTPVTVHTVFALMG